MAESVVVVCDVCGNPAVQTVTIRVGTRNLVKDFCATHLSELTAGARAPKRGRRPGTVVTTSTPKRRGRPPGSKNKTSTAKRRVGRPKGSTTRKASSNGRRKKAVARRGRPPKAGAAPKRRGRPPKTAAAAAPAS